MENSVSERVNYSKLFSASLLHFLTWVVPVTWYSNNLISIATAPALIGGPFLRITTSSASVKSLNIIVKNQENEWDLTSGSRVLHTTAWPPNTSRMMKSSLNIFRHLEHTNWGQMQQTITSDPCFIWNPDI